MSSHAMLAPSSAKRWMACPPSARAEYDVTDVSTAYSEEGTIAHALAEYMLTAAKTNKRLTMYNAKDVQLLLSVEHTLQDLHDRCIALDGNWDEMVHYVVEDYCHYVWTTYMDARLYDDDAHLYVERRVDLTKYIPDGFGSADAIILYANDEGKHACIYDLKYGKGVKVDARCNPQIMLYALGVISDTAATYDATIVEMHIIQPRIKNYSHYEMPVQALLWWANEMLAPAVTAATQGTGYRHAGAHCQFCKVRLTCRAALAYAEAHQHVYAMPDNLNPEDMSHLLSILPTIESWLGTCKTSALNSMLSGMNIPGYKVVEGRSSTQLSDPDGAIRALEEVGIDRSLLFKPKELLSLTAIKSLVGAATYKTYVQPYTIKVAGKPTIARDDDPRHAITKAEDDFSGFNPDNV